MGIVPAWGIPLYVHADVGRQHYRAHGCGHDIAGQHPDAGHQIDGTAAITCGTALDLAKLNATINKLRRARHL